MATLITKSADGNITDANQFNTVETGTAAVQQTRNNSTGTTTSYVYSSAITDTNLNVLDGLLLYCNRVNTTGTVTVAYSQDNGTTDTRNLTVNASDLPADPSWVFFKFASTLTLDGGTDNKVGVKSSSAGNATFYRDATAGNWTRLLRLTTTATAAAGDVIYIVGDITAAGSTSTRTVTMNDTASTDYGTGVAGAADNGIEIGNAGVLTFGTTAATNYTLKCSGTINVWGAGTLSIGTTGTPIPRGSTATVLLDCGANLDFGLIINNGGTFNSQGLSRTSGKNIYYCKLNSDAAVNATTLNVDTDTGWLDNDVIAVASTTRTASQCEGGLLNGAAGASSLTVDGFGGTGGGVANAHSGTSPTQAEIILLTRNIVISGVSTSLQGYVVFGATSSVDIDWTEFKWLGSSTSGKRGLDCQTTTGSCNVQYSSLHDYNNGIGFLYSGTSGNGFTFSNNVTFNITNFSLSTASASSATWTVDSNIFMRTPSANNLVTLFDIGGIFTNNVLVGSSASGVSFAETGKSLGTFANNTFHSNNFYGVIITNILVDSTLSDVMCWRNNLGGLFLSDLMDNCLVKNWTLFGNLTNITTTTTRPTLVNCIFDNIESNGDTSFSTTSGISLATSGAGIINTRLINSNFSTASGIKTAHSIDINFSNSPADSSLILINTQLNASTEIATQSNFTELSYVGSEKHDQTTGNHKTWKKYGVITVDTTAGLYRTSSPSERLTPSNASSKLISGIKRIAVGNGATLTPSVYVRESVAGDGTDYNGNRIRLILKRNDAIGITSDTVIDTATASSEGAFEQLTGTTAAATDDGVMEFYVDCDGTTGWVNVDDWTVS